MIINKTTLLLLALLTTTQFSHPVFSQKKVPGLTLIKTIPLTGVHGKFDHMALDNKNQKLFLAAKENNTVEVIDLANGKMIHTIKNVSAPQGLLFLPEQNMILICGGGDGTLKGFDASTYKQKFALSLGEEADNIRYSALNHKIYVAFGDGAIAIIDDKTFKKVSEISFTTHPEAFSLDSSGKKIWVNLPGKGIIKVVNLDTKKDIATWKTDNHTDNYAMTVIEAYHEIIVASRTNPGITILNSQTGSVLQSFNCDSDPDAMFYDKKSDKVFISCGGGSVFILSSIRTGTVQQPFVIQTRKGARTCLWSQEVNTLLVALPEIDGKVAEIRLYN